MRILIAMVTVLALAACTNSPETAQARPSGGTEDRPELFAQCMREQGQNVPDPQPDQEWAFDALPKDPPAGWEEALRACQHHIPQYLSEMGPSAQELEQLRAFAVCMREHGIEMTDPDTEGLHKGNMQVRGRLEHVTRAQMEADPQFQAALAACKDKLPADGGKKDSQ